MSTINTFRRRLDRYAALKAQKAAPEIRAAVEQKRELRQVRRALARKGYRVSALEVERRSQS